MCYDVLFRPGCLGSFRSRDILLSLHVFTFEEQNMIFYMNMWHSTDSILWRQGTVSRKPRRLFGPVKPLQNLEPCDYRAVLFPNYKDEGRLPVHNKFQAYTLNVSVFRCRWSKSGFTGPKTFRGDWNWSTVGWFLSRITSLPSIVFLGDAP